MRVTLIHNPKAGANEQSPLDEVLSQIHAAGHEVTCQSANDDDWDKVLEVPADLVAVAGGDGTVGAVALDTQGHLAAATSTGGMTNKRWGRVGDSPIIGAGTYANAHCAVSATGWGEYYIRAVAAHDICARVEYLKKPIADAAKEVVMDVIPKLGGDGGVIALDASGNFATPFNTDGMYRGWIDRDGKIKEWHEKVDARAWPAEVVRTL